jgi:hypothetical protein
MLDMTNNPPLSGMEIIYEGIHREHVPGDEMDIPFIDAIYDLYNEFEEDYFHKEWQRIDDNVKIYQGTYWDDAPDEGPNKPKPSIPIITSCIENIHSDLMDELPTAVIEPDMAEASILARVLTKVLEQEQDACEFETQYSQFAHDFLQDGWAVFETGYDPYMNRGKGGTYIRYINNKNFLCDPQALEMQDGRACFVIDKKPYDWFRQHYPEQFPFMHGGEVVSRDENHDKYDKTVTPSINKSFRVLEMWVKEYDAKSEKTKVHFVKVAGGQVLENSADAYPNGYYIHGQFPFEIRTLYAQKGSPLGLGICDLFKDTQRYADKICAILLENALRAARPRLFVNKDMVDIDDARDFTKSVVGVNGAPDGLVKWMETQPLPSYMMNFMQLLQSSIKNEAGSNDQSRGQTGGGVTAASAITALQDMSTKRSRKEAMELACAFKNCCRMQIEIMRDRNIVTRNVPLTVNGQVQILPFDNRSFNEEPGDMPIEFYIKIKTARQTRFSKMSHNELILQFMNYFQQTADPLIMMEALELDNKETVIDKIRQAQSGGMLNLQKQVMSLAQQNQQMAQELEQYKGAMAQAQQAVVQSDEAKQQQGQSEAPQINAAEAAKLLA